MKIKLQKIRSVDETSVQYLTCSPQMTGNVHHARLFFHRFRAEQEVWPPGSADTVCPRRHLMTQAERRWAKTAQTDHVTLRL